MENLGYYNGRYGRLEEMMIPMNDRVCYFGDGVYDATCCAGHVIYLIDEHIDRFFNSAAMLRIEIPCTKAELRDLLYEMVRKVDGDCLFVYWQVTRGTAMRNHAFPDVPANLWIMIKPASFRDMAQRVRLTEMEDTRFLHCNIKTLNLLPSVMASQKAEERGCFETVFHRGEIVTECAHSNVHILKDGALITHPTDCHILPGVARRHLILACQALGVPVEERPFTMAELLDADEVLVTSSSNFCIVADHLDDAPVGGRAPELVERLQKWLTEEFRAYISENA